MELEDDSATKKVVAGLEGRDGVRPHRSATGEAPEMRAPAGEGGKVRHPLWWESRGAKASRIGLGIGRISRGRKRRGDRLLET
ncbi:hypothetical protein TorRG33x02_039370 [Trema orientale]|uniref:Uncharacterized protein n=1 Tax=Trema orientale TaxID=63057 RepID=A0A2P5FQW7_TREOI|nr:hypothetical protein TorRG33x02_039370 [Trema orientale]